MLTFDAVRKRYGATVAVDGLSLEVRRVEILGLLGPNGAGKSTLVHLAVGLLAPDEGLVRLAGLGNPREPSVRAHIGVAPQALALYDMLSFLRSSRCPRAASIVCKLMIHPRRLEIGVDPSRGAESGMLEGLLTKLAMEDVSGSSAIALGRVRWWPAL